MAKKKGKRVQEVDLYVGQRVRDRRILLGRTQRDMAELIGVTYGQDHLYEIGVTPISAGQLFRITGVLGVPVEHFFEEFEAGGRAEMPKHPRAALETVRAFAAIENPHHREVLAQLVRGLAQD